MCSMPTGAGNASGHHHQHHCRFSESAQPLRLRRSPPPTLAASGLILTRSRKPSSELHMQVMAGKSAAPTAALGCRPDSKAVFQSVGPFKTQFVSGAQETENFAKGTLAVVADQRCAGGHTKGSRVQVRLHSERCVQGEADVVVELPWAVSAGQISLMSCFVFHMDDMNDQLFDISP